MGLFSSAEVGRISLSFLNPFGSGCNISPFWFVYVNLIQFYKVSKLALSVSEIMGLLQHELISLVRLTSSSSEDCFNCLLNEIEKFLTLHFGNSHLEVLEGKLTLSVISLEIRM